MRIRPLTPLHQLLVLLLLKVHSVFCVPVPFLLLKASGLLGCKAALDFGLLDAEGRVSLSIFLFGLLLDTEQVVPDIASDVGRSFKTSGVEQTLAALIAVVRLPDWRALNVTRIRRFLMCGPKLGRSYS